MLYDTEYEQSRRNVSAEPTQEGSPAAGESPLQGSAPAGEAQPAGPFQAPAGQGESAGPVRWSGSSYSGGHLGSDYTPGPSREEGQTGAQSQTQTPWQGAPQGQGSWQPGGSQNAWSQGQGGWQNGAGQAPWQGRQTGWQGSGGNHVPPSAPGGNGPIPSAPRPQRPAKKRSGAARTVAAVLACALVGCGAGFGGAALYDRVGGGSTTVYYSGAAGSTVEVSQADGLTEMSFSEIYASYANSCVCINATVAVSSGNYGWGYGGGFGGQTYEATSAGSGFIITADGYIVTNYHVIEDATSISVSLYNGETYAARVVGTEESSDIAVLKIEVEGLTPVVIGDSDQVNVGEPVCTIGNALGAYSFSLTSGSVSALNRSVTMEDGTVSNMLQTDCTINSGNSGGPLFDQYGRVVGITSAKLSNNGDSSSASIENIGFAIPMNDVYDMITDIIENGYVTGKPSMGIQLATVTEEYSNYFNWPLGAYVNSVESGSCAQAAGLRQGDIITAIGDTQITTAAELVSAKNTYKAGETATLTVYRAGETLTLTITFDEDTTSTLRQSSAT